MRSVKAVFKKQVKDLLKNMAILIQFIIFPVVAFVMTELVAGADDFGMPDTMFVTMFASIFVGMSLIPSIAGIIAEDRERKSLRFLIMAGVKPSAYLLGVGGVIFIVSFFPSLAFSWMGGFSGEEFWIFMSVLMSSVIASTLLGATIGIISKNQQMATGLSTSIALILGFTPMLALFDERIGRIINIFYTQQFNVIVDSFYSITGYQSEAGFGESFLIIWANIAVFAVLFGLAYKKKGLKG